jgi:hypothetical protein
MTKFVNWLGLQPSQAEIDEVCGSFTEAVTWREFRLKLIETILRGFPRDERFDLVEAYHPAQSYAEGEWIALPIPDKNKIHPVVWQIVEVVKTEATENPVQGKFDVLTLDLRGRQFQLACGISDAPFPDSNFSNLPPEDLQWLAAWLENTYGNEIQCTLMKLWGEKRLGGKFANGKYIPMQATEETFTDKPEVAPVSIRPMFYQRIWIGFLFFIQKLFRRKS